MFYTPTQITERQSQWQEDAIDDEFNYANALEDFKIEEPYVRATPKLGRNDPCHCGSGKKYKKCHLDLDNL